MIEIRKRTAKIQIKSHPNCLRGHKMTKKTMSTNQKKPKQALKDKGKTQI